MTAYRFSWKGSGMGHTWFYAAGPEGSGEVEYVNPQHLEPYHRRTHNGTAEAFARDVEAALHVLHWANNPGKPLSPAMVAAFNAWRAEEHAGHVAKLKADPERYGITGDDDPILAPPAVVRGGHYVVGTGWVIAD